MLINYRLKALRGKPSSLEREEIRDDEDELVYCFLLNEKGCALCRAGP